MNITHSFFPYKSKNINGVRFFIPNNAGVYLYDKTYHLFSPFSDTIFSIMPGESFMPPFSDFVGKIKLDDNPILMFYKIHTTTPEAVL